MTSKSISNRIFLLFLVLVCCNTTQAKETAVLGKHSYDKIIQKEFDITKDGQVSLSNRHGKVDIITHDLNKVEIEVRITVEAKSEKVAQEVFDRIAIEFSNSATAVSATTSIAAQSWWDGFWSSNNSSFSIDYYVKMPATNRLDLKNKYGNSYIDFLDASANVDVKYGNVKMEGISDDLNIIIGYGNGIIAKARDANVNLKYGKITIAELKDLNIESKYSKVFVDKAMDVNSVSKYDTYRLGDINELRNTGKYDNFEIDYASVVEATSKYTEFEIDELATSAKLDLRYGNAVVRDIAPGFANIRLDGSYADFKLEFQDGTDYHLDAIGDYSTIRYPKEIEVVFEKDSGKDHELQAFMGNKDSKSFIKARLSYGGLRLR